MRYLRLFRIKREELWASLLSMLLFVVLHALLISKYFEKFSSPEEHYWDVFIKHFRVSGFDPITYAVTTEWGVFYNVYRHPLLAFFVYPFYLINQALISLTGYNLVQIVIALPLLFCSYYSFIFLYRIFREVIALSRFDSTMLTALFFSFGYVMVTFIVPDHFAVSMFMIITTLYLCGKAIQRERHLDRIQTVLLFLFTAGVTLSNGVKVFIDALFVNGKRFFRPTYMVFAVILPSILLWGFARWEWGHYVYPRYKARMEKNAETKKINRERTYQAFLDTTSIKDTAVQNAAFERVMQAKTDRQKRIDQSKPWNKHKGKPIGNGEFEQWTDVTTSRTESFIENLFGESIQLHRDHLLEDTLRKRPVIVRYSWSINYIVEALILIIFIVGIWAGRRSRFLWMALSGFAFDMFLHMGLGFGLNEVYIMSGDWLFVVPIATGFLFRHLHGRRSLLFCRGLVILLVLWLYVYNLNLLIGYLAS